MKSPDAPPTCPDIDLAHVRMWTPAAGAGPEQDQLAHAAAARGFSLAGQRVRNGTWGNRARRVWRGDSAPMQIFTSHPRIVQLVDPGIPQADIGHRLPGRASPTVWDGEPGYRAPNTERR